MIIINPVLENRHAATDTIRKHINTFFATELAEYIKVKGDPCVLTGDSTELDSTLEGLVKKYAPPVVLTVDCYTDIAASSAGYNVVANAYNALVGTITYEMAHLGLTCTQDVGYKLTNSLKYGSVTDITIYLGFVTNAGDLAKLSDDTFLEKVARRIIEGSYGPPIKALNVADNTGNSDPYFYTIKDWTEVAAIDGCSGSIKETLYSGIPVRYLELNSTTTGDYLWTIPTTYTSSTSCILLLTVRSHANAVNLRIKTKSVNYTTSITDTTFNLAQTSGTLVANDYVQVGLNGAGAIDITAVWVAKRGYLGTLDDPRTEYSVFPPGYRLTTTLSTQSTPQETIHAALTTAATLITRAQDSGTTAADTSTQLTTSSSYSSSDYTSAMSGILSQIANVDPLKPLLVDIESLKADPSALLASIASMTDMSQKIATLHVVDDLKMLNESYKALSSGVADKIAEQKEKLTGLLSTKTSIASGLTAVSSALSGTTLQSLITAQTAKYMTQATAMSKLNVNQLMNYKSMLTGVTDATKAKVISALPAGVTSAMSVAGTTVGSISALQANVAGSITSVTSKATDATNGALGSVTKAASSATSAASSAVSNVTKS